MIDYYSSKNLIKLCKRPFDYNRWFNLYCEMWDSIIKKSTYWR